MNDRLLVFAGPASSRLGSDVCGILGVPPAQYECRRFPDGETQIDIGESARGCDVFILQSTSPPVEQHLFELVLMADAARRAGAGRLTAVIPYFGYARQDRRAGRQSLGARVAANVVGTAGFDRVMLIDAHTPGIEGFFASPIDHLTAVPLLARAAAAALPGNAVVVAPDLGAVKRAREYARILGVPMALVHKTRRSAEQVDVHTVIGDVRGRTPIVADDMLSTGSTLEAAVGALRAAGAAEPASAVVTHGLFVGRAREILQRLPLARLLATDTIAIDAPVANLAVTSVASLIATAVRKNHRDESLADLRQ
jgi:ribose-phosphate pyrophosphokinase